MRFMRAQPRLRTHKSGLNGRAKWHAVREASSQEDLCLSRICDEGMFAVSPDPEDGRVDGDLLRQSPRTGDNPVLRVFSRILCHLERHFDHIYAFSTWACNLDQ